MKKILNIYIKASDNDRNINDDCRDSIEIIGKTILNVLLEKLNQYEINILGSHSKNNSVIDFTNLLVLNVFTLCDFEFLKKFKKKIYFFDDLNLWKINNNSEYSNNLIFDTYLSPLEENVDELRSILNNVFYLPFSSSSFLSSSSAHFRTKPISIFLDIWKNRGSEIERGEISIAKAVKFFDKIKTNDVLVYVHEAFSNEIYGSNVKYINDMPKRQFHEFLRSLYFYATSIKSSYEFIILESTLYGSLCIDIDNSVRVEHLKSKATITDQFFYENFQNIVSNFSDYTNSCNARGLYSSERYETIFDSIYE